MAAKTIAKPEILARQFLLAHPFARMTCAKGREDYFIYCARSHQYERWLESVLTSQLVGWMHHIGVENVTKSLVTNTKYVASQRATVHAEWPTTWIGKRYPSTRHWRRAVAIGPVIANLDNPGETQPATSDFFCLSNMLSEAVKPPSQSRLLELIAEARAQGERKHRVREIDYPIT